MCGSSGLVDYISDENLNKTSAGIIKKVLASKKDFQIFIKGEVFVYVDDNANMTTSVEKYSPITKTWEMVTDVHDENQNFCICYFMGKVHIIGGAHSTYTTALDLTNTKNQTWVLISDMNEARSAAASSIFEGRIVVSGGYSNIYRNNYYHFEQLNTVEVYDHIARSWSYMPGMIEKRCRHKSVAIKNKLFVVGGMENTTCEVFDATCNRFVLLKSPPVSFLRSLCEPAEVISIGSKLVVFCDENILIYDTAQSEWSEKSCSHILATFQD